jgi:HD superfamily phosphohydrolase
MRHTLHAHILTHLCTQHEEMSIRMFDDILESLKARGIDYSSSQYGSLAPIDIIFIHELILGTRKGEDKKPLPRIGRGPDKAFLYDIINNLDSGLDVDKLDYLVRDKRHTQGDIISYDRLIMLARVCKVPCPENERMIHHQVDESGYRKAICLPEKAVMEAMFPFQQRMYMHESVYQHRVVVESDATITRVLELANDAVTLNMDACSPTDQGRSIAECVLDPRAFLQLTDGELVFCVHEYMRGHACIYTQYE